MEADTDDETAFAGEADTAEDSAALSAPLEELAAIEAELEESEEAFDVELISAVEDFAVEDGEEAIVLEEAVEEPTAPDDFEPEAKIDVAEELNFEVEVKVDAEAETGAEAEAGADAETPLAENTLNLHDPPHFASSPPHFDEHSESATR